MLGKKRPFSIWFSYMVSPAVFLVRLLLSFLVLLLILLGILNLFVLSAYSDRSLPVLLGNSVLPKWQWRKVLFAERATKGLPLRGTLNAMLH